MASSRDLKALPKDLDQVNMAQVDAIADTAGSPLSYFRSVWRYRYLFWHLAFADLRARFRRTNLGLLWAMLQPLLLMAMFSLLLAQVSNMPYANYTVHVLSGIVMWDLVTTCCSAGAMSYLGASPYLMQSPIPLGVFTVRTVLNALLIYAIGLVTLTLFSLVVLPETVSLKWLWAIPYGLLLVIVATPLAAICGVLNVLFRDFQHILGLFLTGIWMTSPVFAPDSMFEKEGLLRTINQVSPVGRLCAILRDFWMKGSHPLWSDVGVVLAWAALFWLLASWLVSRNERRLIFFIH